MVYPAQLFKAQLQFTFEATGLANEIQDCGFWFTGNGIGDVSDSTCSEMAARICKAWADNIDDAQFSNEVNAVRTSVYYYANNPVQHALFGGEAGFTGDSAWTGSGGGGLPPQISLVVSTLAFAPGSFVPLKGRRQRGRMYPPTPSFAIASSNGTVDGTAQAAYRDHFLAFFADCTGSGGDPVTVMQPIVLSQVDQAGRNMTHLGVGKIFDTQRRRRNKEVENYVYGTI